MQCLYIIRYDNNDKCIHVMFYMRLYMYCFSSLNSSAMYAAQKHVRLNFDNLFETIQKLQVFTSIK